MTEIGIQRAAPDIARGSRGGWLGETARLVGVDLRLMRRRLMTKVLLGILVVGFGLLVGVQLFTYILISGPVGATSGCPRTTQPNGQTVSNCTPAQQQASKALQQQVIDEERASLTFPTGLSLAGGFATFMGLILLCILVGTVAGNEFSYGTHRLALMRGASQPQLLVAQTVALAIVALATSALILLLGALMGVTVGPAIGGVVAGLSLAGWGEVALYWLVIALTLFAYMLIALFVATLGRSVAGGIAGSLGFVLTQTVIVTVLSVLAGTIGGDVGTALGNARFALLGQASGVLLDSVSHTPVAITRAVASAPINGGAALLIVVAWCVVLLGGSYLLLRSRDVTE